MQEPQDFGEHSGNCVQSNYIATNHMQTVKTFGEGEKRLEHADKHP